MADDVQVRFGASIEGVIAGVSEVKEQIEGLAEFSQGITSTFKEMGEALLAAFAVEKIASFVEHLTDLGIQVERTAQQTGLSAEQIAVFDYAAARADVSLEELRRGLERFSLGIQEASKGTGNQAAAFETLGINVRDAAGKIKPMDDVLKEVMDRFAATADGGNKTAIAMALFGRQGADLIPVLDQGSAGLDQLKQSVEATGAVFSTEMQEALADTHNRIIDLDKSTTGISETLFAKFKPALDTIVTGLTDLAQAFIESYKSGGTVAFVLDGIEIAINGLITVIVSAISILNVLWSTARMVFLNIAEFAVKSAESVGDALHGEFKKADEDLIQMHADMDRRWKENADNAVKAWTEASGEISNLWQHLKPPAPEEAKTPKPDMPAFGDALGKDESHMDKWQAQLDEMLSQQKIFGDKAKAVEEDFWKAKLATAERGTKDYEALTAKVYEFENADYTRDVQNYLASLNAKQTAAQGDFAKVQQIEQQKLAFLAKLYGQDSKNYQDELRRKQQMDNQHVQQEQQKFQQFFNSMFSGFNSAVNGMIHGTETFGQAVGQVLDGMLQAVLGIFEKWIAQQAAALIFGETSAQAAAHANIAANAATAGAAAYASTAAIPIIGPELAPAAAATAYAGSLAYEGLASFDVGAWNVNSDQIAKIHAGEMIVPARPAEAWRNSLNAAGGSGGDTHVHINAIDAGSFQRMLKKNPDAIAAAVRTAHRNGSMRAMA